VYDDRPELAALHQQWLDAHTRMVETSVAARSLLEAIADSESIQPDDPEQANRLARDAQGAAAKWVWLNGQYLTAREQIAVATRENQP
jgi:hypothetical protein